MGIGWSLLKDGIVGVFKIGNVECETSFKAGRDVTEIGSDHQCNDTSRRGFPYVVTYCRLSGLFELYNVVRIGVGYLWNE